VLVRENEGARALYKRVQALKKGEPGTHFLGQKGKQDELTAPVGSFRKGRIVRSSDEPLKGRYCAGVVVVPSSQIGESLGNMGGGRSWGREDLQASVSQGSSNNFGKGKQFHPHPDKQKNQKQPSKKEGRQGKIVTRKKKSRGLSQSKKSNFGARKNGEWLKKRGPPRKSKPDKAGN